MRTSEKPLAASTAWRRIRWPRLTRRLGLLAAVLVAALGAALGAWFVGSTRGVETIDPARPPEPVLGPAERDRLAALQSALDVFLMSPISPDGTTVLAAAGGAKDPVGAEPGSAQVGWLNIQTGELAPIDPEFFRLLPQGEAVWRNDETASYLASGAGGETLLVNVERGSGRIQAEALPISGRVLGLAPNGSRVLYEAGEGGAVELRVFTVASAASAALLRYPAGGSPQSFAWTPDGGKLAVVRYEISPELAADPAEQQALAMRDALGNLPLAQNPIFASNVVDVFDLATGTHRPAALRAVDGDGYWFQHVSWSPAGDRLLAKVVRAAHAAGRAHPAALPGLLPDRGAFRLYDGDLALITSLDRLEIEAPSARAVFVSPDEVVVIAPYGLGMHLSYFNLLSGAFRVLPTPGGTFGASPNGYQVYAAPGTRQLVYVESSFERPAEIYRLDLEGGAPGALTNFNATAAAANQIRVDAVSFAIAEGQTRVGYLLQPAGAPFPPRQVPIVLYQQGGPGGAMTNRWGATAEEPFNLLPNFGVAVLFMPYAGREGFGPEFINRLVAGDNFGQVDIDEAAQTVRYLIAHDYARADQIGITGASYGGYFASQSIAQYPELYAAANVQSAVLDLADWWEQNPALVTYVEGAVPDDRPDEYRRDSPRFAGARVRTPLLLLHGSDDRLPVGIVKDFRDAVDAAQTPVRMLVFKSEGHGLTLPVSRLVAAEHQIAWFDKYLRP